MAEENGLVESYRKYRPRAFKGMVGQEGPVKTLKELVSAKRIPHVTLLVGPSGCGKTTTGYILANKLGVETGPGKKEFAEINCADFRGIDTAREIRTALKLRPMLGDAKVWLIDEVHRSTGDFQSALLTMLEKPPSWAYFIFATTDPGKLLPTFRSRCTEIQLSAIGPVHLAEILKSVAAKESVELSQPVVDAIVESAEGSARRALVAFDKVRGLGGDDARIDAIQKGDVKRQSIELARALLAADKWEKIKAVLKGLEDEPEAIRHLVLGYASSVLLGGGRMAQRAHVLIDVFKFNFYDSKKAGLYDACWVVSRNKEGL